MSGFKLQALARLRPGAAGVRVMQGPAPGTPEDASQEGFTVVGTAEGAKDGSSGKSHQVWPHQEVRGWLGEQVLPVVVIQAGLTRQTEGRG